MSPRSKREYIEVVHLRYKQASRNDRKLILNELCATCGYNRKYAIRLLRGYKRFTKPKPRKRGKPSFYQREEILRPLWPHLVGLAHHDRIGMFQPLLRHNRGVHPAQDHWDMPLPVMICDLVGAVGGRP